MYQDNLSKYAAESIHGEEVHLLRAVKWIMKFLIDGLPLNNPIIQEATNKGIILFERNYKKRRKGLQLWILKNVQIIRYTFRCFVKCRLKKDCLKHLSYLNLPGSFLFMGYTRGSRILAMKNLKKHFWSVWINVTTGIIKEGYSST